MKLCIVSAAFAAMVAGCGTAAGSEPSEGVEAGARCCLLGDAQVQAPGGGREWGELGSGCGNGEVGLDAGVVDLCQ